MATQITNKATLEYNSGPTSLIASSNTAAVTLQGPLEVTKYTHEISYRIGDEITYNVFIKNTSASTTSSITVEDDLGTYALTPTVNVTPLTHIFPAKVYINNEFSASIRGTISPTKDSVTFDVGNLMSGQLMLLQYKAKVNEYAGAVVGTSEIKNTVSVKAASVTTAITASSTIPVSSYADVTIEKTMSPDPVVDGDTLTYTFLIKNYGTIAATNVYLNDTFTTTPVITSVSVNGNPTTAYAYTSGVFTYPDTPATIYSIPAATYTQDPATGVVTVVPGTSEVVITGTI